MLFKIINFYSTLALLPITDVIIRPFIIPYTYYKRPVNPSDVVLNDANISKSEFSKQVFEKCECNRYNKMECNNVHFALQRDRSVSVV